MPYITPDELKKSLSNFVSGVTIVTTMDTDERPFGFTCSSFTSVSLSPPLVSICIDKSRRSYDVFARTDTFAVNILSEKQGHLARHFASPIANKFDGISYSDKHGCPSLSGVMTVMQCEVYRRIELGDHLMLVGLVKSSHFRNEKALGYVSGGFLRPGLDFSGVNATHGISVGWLIEHNESIILSSNIDEEKGYSLPAAEMPNAKNTTKALLASATKALSANIEIGFLYSVTDVPNESTTRFVYTASLLEDPYLKPGLQWYQISNLPWEKLDSISTTILKRYLKERQEDHFGLFITLEEGKVAKIGSIESWKSIV